jgi:hypothetical protein
VPTRKQKRRREKLQRHEYEYVIETETGEEIPVESPRQAERAAREGPSDGKKTAAKGPVDRRGRPLQPPSWRRAFRRGAIFAPLMAVFVYITSKGQTDNVAAAVVAQTALLLAFFLPFSYVVDVFMYRMLTRRYERERAERRSGR